MEAQKLGLRASIAEQQALAEESERLMSKKQRAIEVEDFKRCDALKQAIIQLPVRVV